MKASRLTSDNPKCFALTACRYEPVLNPAFERFATHYGFAIECLPPRDPQKKGKIERMVPYVRRLSVDATGGVKITNDREAIEPCGPKLVCVGLFSFADGQRLAAELARAVAQPSPRREPLFVALESYSSAHPMHLRPTQRWMDCGHVDDGVDHHGRLGLSF